MAAATEGVRIERMGFKLVSCCLPVAYVQLDEQALALLPPTKQLAVFAAGVWHNAVLVAACALVLQTLPVWLSPLFLSNQGAWCVSVLCTVALPQQTPSLSMATSRHGDHTCIARNPKRNFVV